MDEVTNDGINDEQRAYHEGLRQSVATIQSMNASHLEIARKLEGMTASFLAGPAEKMLVENERSRRYYQQIGAVQAAQATAYETIARRWRSREFPGIRRIRGRLPPQHRPATPGRPHSALARPEGLRPPLLT